LAGEVLHVGVERVVEHAELADLLQVLEQKARVGVGVELRVVETIARGRHHHLQ